MKNSTILVFVFLTLCFCFQETVAQCACKQQYKNLTAEKAFDLANFVFTGKVISKKRVQNKLDKEKYELLIEFEVNRVWKGSFVGKNKEVYNKTNRCSLTFQVNEEFLIYSYLDGDDLTTHCGCCTRTARLVGRSDDVRFFDAFKKSQEGKVLSEKEADMITSKTSLLETGGVSKKWQIKYVCGIIPREFYVSPIFATEDAVLQDTEIKEIDGIKVTVNTYEYKKIKRLYNEVQTCDTERDNLSLVYNEFDYGFENFQTYSINDKVFGYYVNYWVFEPNTKGEIGFGFANIYFQQKENGIFKIECEKIKKTESVTELETIPNWIKSLTKNRQNFSNF